MLCVCVVCCVCVCCECCVVVMHACVASPEYYQWYEAVSSGVKLLILFTVSTLEGTKRCTDPVRDYNTVQVPPPHPFSNV